MTIWKTEEPELMPARPGQIIELEHEGWILTGRILSVHPSDNPEVPTIRVEEISRRRKTP